jgi:anaerobic magnesium-protoporphyrin IX monomethyl ester cyclase
VDILLINSVIREFAQPNNVPLGVCYLSSVLKQAGHNVDVCDLNGLRQINTDREYWLSQYMNHYDMIGLSGLVTTYNEQRRYLDFIMAHYKAFGMPLLVTGGGLGSSCPEFVHRNMPEIEVIVKGEGEEEIVWIAETRGHPLNPKASIGEMNGVYHGNLDNIPFPDWDAVPTKEVYLGNPIWGQQAGNSSRITFEAKRSMNMIVSRGCPSSCNFCYKFIFGNQYRLRSVGNVIAEIQELKDRYDVDFVGFVDDNTTANRQWVLRFCYELIHSGLDIHWGCSARVNQADTEMLKLMKRAGCEWIGFGVESASTKILANMNKRTNPEMARNAIQMVREAGIWANATFMCGYPGETVETLRETAKFMKDNECLGSMFFATPYPGTVLYEQVKSKIIDKYGSEDSYIMSLGDATEFRINLSEMEDNELIEYRQLAIEGKEF